MMLGETSYWLWFAGAFVLGAVIAYGMIRAGRLRRAERQRLDRNTEARQQQEDPSKLSP